MLVVVVKIRAFPATLLSFKDRLKAADMIGKMGEVRAHIITMVNHVHRPLWIHLSSKDDWITKNIFPKARWTGQKLSDWGRKYTIGHYMPYVSHSITIERTNSLPIDPDCTFIQNIFA